ncbi:MAG TPA: AraC family transcriptional regulator [Marmoricola sp.]|nr:AraC family transcriptional regulator [Marmoricola sp.]
MFNLSILADHCIFSTQEKSDSHALVAAELADHRLQWHGDRVDTRMCKLDTANLSLYSLTYGAGVDIFPEVYQDFSLVHFSLRRAIEVAADESTIGVPTGRALVSSPRSRISLSYQEDSEQLILRVPHNLTRRVAAKTHQERLHEQFVTTPGLLLSQPASEVWQTQLQSFAALDRAARAREELAVWRRHFEEGFALFLLSQYAGRVPDENLAPDRLVARTRILDHLIDYVRDNLDTPIGLEEMAAVVSLSTRQLNVLCHQRFGQPPMSWLRGLRLDAIHAELLAHPEQNLANVAMRYGFFHSGRFSAAYRARFGELPSRTRADAKNG